MGLTQRLEKYVVTALGAALALGAAWVFVRYLLPVSAPFLVAFALAALIEPAVAALRRRGWPRSLAAGMLTLLVLGILAGLLALIAARMVSEATQLAAAMPEFLEQLGAGLSALEGRALDFAARAPAGVETYVRTALDSLSDGLYKVPELLSEKLLGLVGRLAQASPSALLFAVTTGIGVYFVSASYPEIKRFILRQIPQRWHGRAREAKSDLRGTLGKFLRAQLILLFMTFGELLAALSLLGVRGAVTLSGLIALVDALPVLGTGTVLLPWAAYALLTGGVPLGLGLVITYAVVTVLRSCVQPKLIGDQLGLHPVASLVAMYAGWCAAGVWGMLIFPLILVTAKQLNDRDVLRLWRREENA